MTVTPEALAAAQSTPPTFAFGAGPVGFTDHAGIALTSGPGSFWPEALPWAQQAHSVTGVLVSVILSQWAIETGYGGPDWLPPRNNPGNVGNFSAGGQLDFPTLAAGVVGYEKCMMQGYYVGVRTASGYVNQSLALGYSPWAGGQYRLPGGGPGSELIYVVQNYNLTQYDGGAPQPVPTPTPTPTPQKKEQSMIDHQPNGGGFVVARPDGAVDSFNGAPNFGSMAGHPLGAPIVGIAFTASGNGYTLVGQDGSIYNFGDSQYYGPLAKYAQQWGIVGKVIGITRGAGNIAYTLVTDIWPQDTQARTYNITTDGQYAR